MGICLGSAKGLDDGTGEVSKYLVPSPVLADKQTWHGSASADSFRSMIALGDALRPRRGVPECQAADLGSSEYMARPVPITGRLSRSFRLRSARPGRS
jgi:hypothetical protein